MKLIFFIPLVVLITTVSCESIHEKIDEKLNFKDTKPLKVQSPVIIEEIVEGAKEDYINDLLVTVNNLNYELIFNKDTFKTEKISDIQFFIEQNDILHLKHNNYLFLDKNCSYDRIKPLLNLFKKIGLNDTRLVFR